MLPTNCQMALKEWAVTVDAMAQGDQVLLLRKGGIHEDGKDFRVIHREFLFYPTYLHQKEDLLQPAYQPALQRVLEQPHDDEHITFTHWAKAEEVLEIEEQEKVDALEPHHIWTTAYAQSKLHWKPMLPLSVMLLRVYKLEQPVTVPFLKEYSGCTSWVEVLKTVNLGKMEAVLDDAEFQRRVDKIKGSLGLAVTAG
ncbi:MAG: DUF1802 family protein [Chloroflexi bacterium]|nr:DUF1802 family protein [Chloroflexota bacterium]MDA1270207.1 DUF1802 family protein [Chloroflexota bacterium]PKB59775.1 MAG: hypothetical protein BZY83_00080 [SAR202 cluster bacterium Casp-Chloro-G2]